MDLRNPAAFLCCPELQEPFGKNKTRSRAPPGVVSVMLSITTISGPAAPHSSAPPWTPPVKPLKDRQAQIERAHISPSGGR